MNRGKIFNNTLIIFAELLLLPFQNTFRARMCGDLFRVADTVHN